ncbi:MAG: hypothetical protein H6Q69_1839 [Firmicutes bacterium]|nr:hypothetical protein [Bacillota bacterium]
MARRSSISAAKTKIENYFDNENIKVYTTRQLEHILNVNKYGWGLPNSYLYGQFILFLSEKSKSEKCCFRLFYGNN